MTAPAAATPARDLRDVRDALDARMATHRRDLEALVRIPSVSAPGFDPEPVTRSAEAVRDLLTARGLQGARLLTEARVHPTVYAERRAADPHAPTVLLYAHHDVQPPGDPARWTTPAFEPHERDGRLYGRGAADDKAGVLVHVAAVSAWLDARGALPVTVKVVIEGEEETANPHLDDFLARHAELLRADAVVITDSVNWRVGVPALTTTLRGAIDCEVELRGLDHAVHSGLYGGPVADPVLGLVRLLAGLVDADGVVAIPGFADDARPVDAAQRARLEALDFDEDAFRADAGVLDGVALVGDPQTSVPERLWLRPSATITGIDVPAVAVASNTIQPSARARLSLRLAPGQDAARALTLLRRWLTEQAPWGLQVSVSSGAAAPAFSSDPDHPAVAAAAQALEAAYGAPTVFAGVGGSIPIVTSFVEAFSAAAGRPVPALVTGVEDPDSRAHGIDESLHLGDWRNACVAEAYLLGALAETLREGA